MHLQQISDIYYRNVHQYPGFALNLIAILVASFVMIQEIGETTEHINEKTHSLTVALRDGFSKYVTRAKSLDDVASMARLNIGSTLFESTKEAILWQTSQGFAREYSEYDQFLSGLKIQARVRGLTAADRDEIVNGIIKEVDGWLRANNLFLRNKHVYLWWGLGV